MAAAKRIYILRNAETGVERLVRASNATQARAHVARDTFSISVASQDQLVALLTAEDPPEVETAGEDLTNAGDPA